MGATLFLGVFLYHTQKTTALISAVRDGKEMNKRKRDKVGGGWGAKNVILKIGKSPKCFLPSTPTKWLGQKSKPPEDQHYPRPFQKYIVCGGQISANMQNRQYAKPLEGPKTYQFCPHQFFHPFVYIERPSSDAFSHEQDITIITGYRIHI